MNKKKSSILAALSILLPVLGGFLGCGIELERMKADNVEWILMWSLPISGVALFFTLGICGVKHSDTLNDGIFGLFACIILIAAFLFSFKLVEGACGV